MENQKELYELLESIKDEYQKEIKQKESEIFFAKDKMHYLNCKLIELENVENYKESVKEMINNYYSDHLKRSMGRGSKSQQQFNKSLKEKVEKSINQLDN